MEKNNVKKSNNKTSKVKIKNPKRFFIVIIVAIILLIAFILIINANSKIDISKDTNISELNAKKYSNEILVKYNQEGIMEKFLEDYDIIQNAIGLYIINNSTMDENSFSNILSTLKTELKKSEWELIDINKPTFWNGEWSTDDNGILKFKFASKEIEPNWINSEELTGKISINN